MDRSEGVSGLIIFSAVVAASLAGFLFVHYYGVDIPFADDWDMLPGAQFFMEKGTVSYRFFFDQHNENFHFFPKLITAATTIATGCNMKSLMCLSLACFMAVAAITAVVYYRHVRGVVSSVLFAPVPFLMLGFIQYENFLWGMQLVLMFTEALAAIVFFLLCRERLGRAAFFWAVACAVMSSFSYSHGNLVWPIGFALLMVYPSSTRLHKRVWIASWILVWGMTAISFKNPREFGLLEPLQDPLRAISFFLESLGASLGVVSGRHPIINQLLGAIIVIVLTLNLVALRRRISSFWHALSAFSAATLLLISIGRCAMEDICPPSRSAYMTHGLLIVSLAFITALLRLRDQRSLMIRSAAPCALAVVLSVCVAAGDRRGIKGAFERMDMLEKYQFILSEYETYPDSYLAKIHPKPWVIRGRALFLRMHGYNVFKNHGYRNRDLSLAATGAIKGTFKTSGIIVDDIEDRLSISAYLDDEITFDPEKAYVEIGERLFRAYVYAGTRLLRRTVWKGVLKEGMSSVKIVLLVDGMRYESESSVTHEVTGIPASVRLFGSKWYDDFSTLYDIDDINLSLPHHDPVVSVGGCHLYIRGWAVDSKWRSRAGGVFVKIDDRLFETRFGLARPDIAKEFRYYRYKHSGFEACISLGDIPPGTHKLGIVVVGADSARYYYQPTKDISVALSGVRDHQIRSVISGLNYMKVPTRYAIESINGLPVDAETINVAKGGGGLVVRGWAIDKFAGVAPGKVYVVLDDIVVEANKMGRPDVAQALANDRFLNCGFEAVFPAGSIGLEGHSLSLIVVTADKKGYYLLDEQSYYHPYGPWIKISVEH